MKTLLYFCVLVLPLASIARQEEGANAARPVAPPGTTVEMSDGKVWLIVNGKTSLLKEEVVIGSTRVFPDGIAVLKDGTRQRLKNGDKVNEKGGLQRVTDKLQEPAIPPGPEK